MMSEYEWNQSVVQKRPGPLTSIINDHRALGIQLPADTQSWQAQKL